MTDDKEILAYAEAALDAIQGVGGCVLTAKEQDENKNRVVNYLLAIKTICKQKEVWEPVGDLGDVMPLSVWIGEVIHGHFIDYDGYGHYVRDGKMRTDIMVVPSMLKRGEIDHSFDQIIWFNR
jgi:hypothetical protein